MSSFRFASPWLLAGLLLCAAAVWVMLRGRNRIGRLELPRAQAALQLGTSGWVRLSRSLPWLRGIVLSLLIVGLARPQAGEQVEDISTFGVDIVVALDVSGSMRAEDFKPANRLAVAKRTVEQFVQGRPADRIGLVVFASLATTRCPLTLDHEMLLQFLREVDFAPPDQRLTAIGMGLATSVNRLRKSDARSRVVVLVTDGMNTAGQIGPKAAAQAAKALGIKVYTIGVGREGQVPIPVDTPFGRQYQMMQTDIDEELLQEIAQLTDGRYFRASDAETLAQIFTTIDSLERTEIESRVRVLYSERFFYLVLPALALLLLERGLAGTRLRRIP